jgi:hypothetical protein
LRYDPAVILPVPIDMIAGVIAKALTVTINTESLPVGAAIREELFSDPLGDSFQIRGIHVDAVNANTVLRLMATDIYGHPLN